MKYIQFNENGEYLGILVDALYEWDANNFCTPAALVKDGKSEQFRVFEMVGTEQPAHDQITQVVRETTPDLVQPGRYEQRWEVVPKYATPEEEAAAIAADQEAKASAAREEAKRKRAEAVANIQVTTSAGHTFDGDEESQTRMSRAIIGMLSSQTESSGAVTLPWVLSDNTVIQVDVGELTEALTLAGMEQARLWVIE